MECIEEIEELRSNSQNEAKQFLRSYYHELYENLINTRQTMPMGDAGFATGGETPSKKRADF